MIYNPDECVVFWKTREDWGGLSNMAAGYSITHDDVIYLTAEALYQACKFPNDPEIRKAISDAPNPVHAKKIAGFHSDRIVPGWIDRAINLRMMHWVLRMKLAHHPDKFGGLLESTGDKPIVERSSRDRFWGAVPGPDGMLHGENTLGIMLMDLRAERRLNIGG